MARVYKTFPEHDYLVRAMTEKDLVQVLEWWYHMGEITKAEFEVPLKSFKNQPGLYIGEHKGEVVASALRAPWTENDPKVYYGSMYYVAEKHRGKGFGTMLRDQVAKGHIGDGILCIDAVEGKVATTNEKKFEYKTVNDTNRYISDAKQSMIQEVDFKIENGRNVPFDKLLAYDKKYFISSNSQVRQTFLQEWINYEGSHCVVIASPDDEILAYGCLQKCQQPDTHMIGPLYADSYDLAAVVYKALCNEVAGQKVVINIRTSNAEAVKLVEELSMDLEMTVVRQVLNGPVVEKTDGVYAVTSIICCGF